MLDCHGKSRYILFCNYLTMEAVKTPDVVPVSSTPKESTREMISRMMSDSKINQEELLLLVARYEEEKANIEVETKSQLESLLKSTIAGMLDGSGVQLNKDNMKVLEKFLGGTIPKDIVERINSGENLTLISKDSKLVEKVWSDALRNLK